MPLRPPPKPNDFRVGAPAYSDVRLRQSSTPASSSQHQPPGRAEPTPRSAFMKGAWWPAPYPPDPNQQRVPPNRWSSLPPPPLAPILQSYEKKAAPAPFSVFGKNAATIAAGLAAVVAPKAADATEVAPVCTADCPPAVVESYSNTFKVHFEFSTDAVIFILLVFFAGVICGLLANRCWRYIRWKKFTITAGWRCPAGGKIHCLETCARHYSRSSEVHSWSFCSRCTPFGLSIPPSDELL